MTTMATRCSLLNWRCHNYNAVLVLRHNPKYKILYRTVGDLEIELWNVVTHTNMVHAVSAHQALCICKEEAYALMKQV